MPESAAAWVSYCHLQAIDPPVVYISCKFDRQSRLAMHRTILVKPF